LGKIDSAILSQAPLYWLSVAGNEDSGQRTSVWKRL